jgi:AcrR family transcriptional regulator
MGTDESEELATQSLVHQLRARRSNMMVAEVETVALRLFHERGFSAVTVEEIASAARISVRTFYRYFPSKEDVLQVQIDRRAEAVRAALAARPVDEAPLHSLRVALTEAIASEDAGRTRTWTEVVAAAPEVLQAVLGGILLKTQRAIAEFFAARLNTPDDSLVPTMLAAAAVGIIQTSQAHWLIYGGDLTTRISEGFEVLEHGIGSDPRTWSTGT